MLSRKTRTNRTPSSTNTPVPTTALANPTTVTGTSTSQRGPAKPPFRTGVVTQAPVQQAPAVLGQASLDRSASVTGPGGRATGSTPKPPSLADFGVTVRTGTAKWSLRERARVAAAFAMLSVEGKSLLKDLVAIRDTANNSNSKLHGAEAEYHSKLSNCPDGTKSDGRPHIHVYDNAFEPPHPEQVKSFGADKAPFRVFLHEMGHKHEDSWIVPAIEDFMQTGQSLGQEHNQVRTASQAVAAAQGGQTLFSAVDGAELGAAEAELYRLLTDGLGTAVARLKYPERTASDPKPPPQARAGLVAAARASLDQAKRAYDDLGQRIAGTRGKLKARRDGAPATAVDAVQPVVAAVERFRVLAQRWMTVCVAFAGAHRAMDYFVYLADQEKFERFDTYSNSGDVEWFAETYALVALHRDEEPGDRPANLWMAEPVFDWFADDFPERPSGLEDLDQVT
jgi:hypothetical protein